MRRILALYINGSPKSCNNMKTITKINFIIKRKRAHTCILGIFCAVPGLSSLGRFRDTGLGREEVGVVTGLGASDSELWPLQMRSLMPGVDRGVETSRLGFTANKHLIILVDTIGINCRKLNKTYVYNLR